VSTIRARILALLLAVGAVLAPWRASAEPARAPDAAAENERLHELFEQAGRALDHDDFAGAARLLRQVWAARQTADVAANLAVAELGIGQPAAAGRHAAFARRHLLPSATPEQRSAIDVLLARARSEAAVLVIEVEPSRAEVLVGGESIEPEERAELFVAPGEHTVVARLDGASVDRTIVVAVGARQRIPLVVPPRANGADAPTAADGEGTATPHRERRRHPSPVPLAASLGVAVAGGAMAVGYGIAAGHARDDADRISDSLGPSDSACYDSTDPRCEDLEDLRSREGRRRDLQLAGVVVAGAGASAAIVSGVIFVARRGSMAVSASPPRRSPARGGRGDVTARGEVTPDGARVAVRITF
jgi:hypothetical protein